jgi:hypothetical protein
MAPWSFLDGMFSDEVVLVFGFFPLKMVGVWQWWWFVELEFLAS